MFSHDWPDGIVSYGKNKDVEKMFKIRPGFKESIEQQTGLGNPAAMDLLKEIRPKYWFAAHMHYVFRAEVPHVVLKEELPTPENTKFLALDKPLVDLIPGREFLTVSH